MELRDLVGLHELSGVDMNVESIKQYGDNFEDCSVINFMLDGQVYAVTEDPDDGWRSAMRSILKSNYIIKNTFFPCKVEGVMDNQNEILNLVDVNTNKIILSIGTDYSDDWYPCFVSIYSPENMIINTQGEKMIEKFAVNHYYGRERPTIKGNSFDGLEIGAYRTEAEEFIKFVNNIINKNKQLEERIVSLEESELKHKWYGYDARM